MPIKGFHRKGMSLTSESVSWRVPKNNAETLGGSKKARCYSDAECRAKSSFISQVEGVAPSSDIPIRSTRSHLPEPRKPLSTQSGLLSKITCFRAKNPIDPRSMPDHVKNYSNFAVWAGSLSLKRNDMDAQKFNAIARTVVAAFNRNHTDLSEAQFFLEHEQCQALEGACLEKVSVNSAFLLNKHLKESTGKICLGSGWRMLGVAPVLNKMFFGINKSRDRLMETGVPFGIRQMKGSEAFVETPYYADPIVRACVQTLLPAKLVTIIGKMIDSDALSRRDLEAKLYTWVARESVDSILFLLENEIGYRDAQDISFSDKFKKRVDEVTSSLSSFSTQELNRLPRLVRQNNPVAMALKKSLDQLVNQLYKACLLHAADTGVVNFSLEDFDFGALKDPLHPFKGSTTSMELKFLVSALEQGRITPESVAFHLKPGELMPFNEVVQAMKAGL